MVLPLWGRLLFISEGKQDLDTKTFEDKGEKEINFVGNQEAAFTIFPPP